MRTSVVAAMAAVLAAVSAPAAGAGELSPRTNYILRCTGCHGMDGAGSPIGGIPDFRNLVGAFAADEEGRSYIMHVPGVVASGLTDREIAGVVNFVMTTWAGSSLPPDFRPFTEQEVTRLRLSPVNNVVDMRRALVARLKAQGVATADYPWP